MELLHFTGQVWRPPYEASSQLLQVTAGCTHSKCKFCSLYHGTKFRLSPIAEVEEDLKVIQSYQPKARRVFLTGANPFVLSYNRLLDLGLLIRKYLRYCESIGMFSRISDIKSKTVEELQNLRHLGFDSISIGTESGDDNTLAMMNKGYTANDIIEQCKKLEEANIRYNFVYLTGLAGRNKGEQNAVNTAANGDANATAESPTQTTPRRRARLGTSSDSNIKAAQILEAVKYLHDSVDSLNKNSNLDETNKRIC